jgi:hypothetical protein
MTMTITNIDTGSVVLKDPQYADELLALAGADEILAGTILARRRVATAIVAAADVGNTSGSGTCTAAAVVHAGGVIPIVGAYNLECITKVANGGIFKLVDPNGALVADNLQMTVGATAATVFEVGGMTFTLTDATDFEVGDKFSLTVSADYDLVPFARDGVGGACIPCAVLTNPLSAGSGADYPIRALVGGQVRREKLIIDADGDGDDITKSQLDTLRSFGIVAVSVSELGDYDTQD